MAHILIVDDESSIRESLRGILEDENYKISVSPSGEDCLDQLRKRTFDLILLDVWLTGIDGLEVLQKIREMEDPPEVIMISGHGTIETAVRATKLGAYDFAEKPLPAACAMKISTSASNCNPRVSSSATAFP
jgi:two-component system nitrogen regulation response regulator NtrX